MCRCAGVRVFECACNVADSRRAHQVWLNTPDGRKGWASYYLERGHEVYIVDLYGVGRSGRRAAEATRDSASAEVIERVFTVPEDDPFYPQAVKHDQWPGVSCVPPPYPRPCRDVTQCAVT